MLVVVFQAMSYQQRAVLMSERVLGIDHPNTITEYVSGVIMQTLNQYKTAIYTVKNWLLEFLNFWKQWKSYSKTYITKFDLQIELLSELSHFGHSFWEIKDFWEN